jgi:hypothetical protein
MSVRQYILYITPFVLAGGMRLGMNISSYPLKPTPIERHSEEHQASQVVMELKSGLNVRIRMNAPRTMNLLLIEEDTDGDKKITVNDTLLRSGARGDGRFVFAGSDSAKYSLSGTYHLSNLLQELAWSMDQGDSIAVIPSGESRGSSGSATGTT